MVTKENNKETCVCTISNFVAGVHSRNEDMRFGLALEGL